MTRDVVKNFFAMFSAIGAGARGMKRARVEVAGMAGSWQCIGGIDVDDKANRVFRARLGVPALTMDLRDREQYIAMEGHEPPPGWREATPDDIRRAAHHQHPHAVFLSAPCKGFSGLLSETRAATAKYQALNRLTLRGVWLMLEAWIDNPPEIILFENVPRLATRGRDLLDRITAMLRSYGYVTAETTHDCGELGGLAQHRKRFLLVARRLDKVPNFLYEPPRRAMRAVGDILGRMPMAGDPVGGVMHRLPSLQWRTWVRLAFVEAGSDWRSLNRLQVEDGQLRDYLIVPAMHRGGYGVRRWDESTGVVASESRPSNGAFSVADPRVAQSADWNGGQHYGVHRMEDSTGAVTAQAWPNQGRFAVADPRVAANEFHGFRVVRWDREAGAITAGRCSPGGSAQAIADPRPGWNRHGNNLTVGAWDASSRTVIAGGKGVQGGWLSVADPRPGLAMDRENYLSGGHYGVVPWSASSGAVSATACHDNGRWSVADPRTPTSAVEEINMPAIDDRLVATILAEDGTHHRPFTTLELAALQSMFDPANPAEVFAFTGAFLEESTSDSMHREWIGNAVPEYAAEAIGTEILRTLMLADAGETFSLSATPIWVRPVVTALTLAQGGIA